ncbi:hypothetical protein CU669_19235 [Paramagnetospirillum kuznetsovii]|uniref:Uncharacterized protein n=1 Tax=Paramagnetospirillum kuznetsovii TaxID=2053833 RepID=A0A364NTD4_9PROT|nr:hypothetical protein [Paramagnetospirillum kuznetsovii]RAU20302.1 hypothetical protein CU669_19235 [Paramagnetospirillum kuznetsovii]
MDLHEMASIGDYQFPLKIGFYAGEGVMRLRDSVFLILIMMASTHSEAAQASGVLSCRSASESECRPTGCMQQDLRADLTFDSERKLLRYCAGEGCYAARVATVKAEDGGVSFAADAKAEDGRSGRIDRLVTIHPGRRGATVGAFLADGSVLFTHMNCGEGP